MTVTFQILHFYALIISISAAPSRYRFCMNYNQEAIATNFRYKEVISFPSDQWDSGYQFRT